MHDLDPAALRAFLAVAESGSFTEAAARLHLTQPAVTRRVQALEQRLGAPLFDRLPRRALLTETGRRLLPQARRALEALAECARAVESSRSEVSGTLRLGTSHHIGLHHLPPVLRRFHRRYPAVELALSFLGSEAALSAVEQGELDLALVTLPLRPPSGLEQVVWWHDHLSLVVARDHPLAHSRAFDPHALAAHEAVLPEEGTTTRELIDRALASWGVRPRTALASNHLEILRMLVGAGLGWSLLPETLVNEGLVQLPTPAPLERRLGVVYHPRRRLGSAARAFLDLLPQPLAGDPRRVGR